MEAADLFLTKIFFRDPVFKRFIVNNSGTCLDYTTAALAAGVSLARLNIAPGDTGVPSLVIPGGKKLTIPVNGAFEFDTITKEAFYTFGHTRKRLDNDTAASSGITSFGPVGSSSNGTAVSVSSGVATLLPAASGFPGIVNATTQAFSGVKEFVNDTKFDQHIVSNSSTPSGSPGFGIGTGQAVTVTGTDIAGIISFTTGTLPNANDVVMILTFNASYSAAPIVHIQPGNTNARALSGGSSVFVPVAGQTNGVTTGNFIIQSGTTALVASTPYVFTYHVIQ